MRTPESFAKEKQPYRRYVYFGDDPVPRRLDQIAANEMVLMWMNKEKNHRPPYDANEVAQRINELSLWHNEINGQDLIKRCGKFYCLKKAGENMITCFSSAFVPTDMNYLNKLKSGK